MLDVRRLQSSLRISIGRISDRMSTSFLANLTVTTYSGVFPSLLCSSSHFFMMNTQFLATEFWVSVY